MQERDDSIAADIARGVSRLLSQMDYSPITELTLRTGRRIDVAGINKKGEILFVEIKSGLADYRSDQKWPEYLDYCDRFFFAVNADFPSDIIPDSAGLIIADRYGAQIMREVPKDPAHAARRRTVLIRYGRTSAQRLRSLLEGELYAATDSAPE